MQWHSYIFKFGWGVQIFFGVTVSDASLPGSGFNFPFSCKLTEMQDALSLFSAEVQRWAIKWELNEINTFWCPCFEKWKIAYVKISRRFDNVISKAHFLLIACQYRCPVWKGLGLWGWFEILTKKSSWLKCVEMFWERFTVLALAYRWKCSGLSVVLLFRGIWSMRKPRDAGNAGGVLMLPVFLFPLGFKSCSVTCTCKICLLIAVQFCSLKNVRSPCWRLLNRCVGELSEK